MALHSSQTDADSVAACLRALCAAAGMKLCPHEGALQYLHGTEAPLSLAFVLMGALSAVCAAGWPAEHWWMQSHTLGKAFPFSKEVLLFC